MFHPGYWGDHVGYYGGVNYGFGYMGIGFVGGMWRGHDFVYNTAVVHVNERFVHTTYIDRTIVERNTIVNDRHVAFSGGPGGIHHDPRPEERFAERDRHIEATQFQHSHESSAMGDRSLYFKNNGGRPANAAVERPMGGGYQGHGDQGRVNFNTAPNANQNNGGNRNFNNAQPGNENNRGRDFNNPQPGNGNNQGRDVNKTQPAGANNQGQQPQGFRPPPQSRPAFQPAQQAAPQQQPRPEPQVQPRSQPDFRQSPQQRPEPQAQPRPQPQAQPRPQPQAQPRPQPQAQHPAPQQQQHAAQPEHGDSKEHQH
jgi:hypothetical protein